MFCEYIFCLRERPNQWLIPAHAGNTVTAAPAYCMRAHPRARGEYNFVGLSDDGAMGSSPHTRGIPVVEEKTIAPSSAHPRMRGEYVNIKGTTPPKGGSSPRARGV